MRYLADVGNVLMDRSADELIGAVVIALALSLAATGLSMIGRRGAKKTAMPMIVLAFVANLVSMVLAAGHVAGGKSRDKAVAHGGGVVLSVGPVHASAGALLARKLFSKADADHDGLVSDDEAANAAAAFVREAAARPGRQSIDAETLESLLQNALATLPPPPGRFPMPFPHPVHGGPRRPGEPIGEGQSVPPPGDASNAAGPERGDHTGRAQTATRGVETPATE